MLTCFHDENEQGRKALRVAAMLAHFPAQEQRPEILAVIAEDYMTAIDGLPAYSVEHGIRALLHSGQKWRPTIKEVSDACEMKARNYLKLKKYIKQIVDHWGE